MISLFKSFQVVLTPNDRYELVKNRRNPVRTPTAASIAGYEGDLNQLSGLLRDAEFAWYLEGGMGLAAHLGKFHRRHSDIDIGVFSEDIPALEALLADHNYGFFSRNPRIKPLEYSRMDVICRTSSDEILSNKRVKRLTAIKIDPEGRATNCSSLLPRFDIHVHYRGRGDGYVYVTHARHAFPVDLFHCHGSYVTRSGSSIRVASAPFLYFFKLQGRRPKERFDRQLIERFGLMSPLQAKRVRAAVGRLGQKIENRYDLQSPAPLTSEYGEKVGSALLS